MTKFLKGMCYAAFPNGYNPSTANNTCIWFGSDMASYNIKPLWGDSFSPIDGPDSKKLFKGRDDLGNLKKLGVNLIRLYDWDPRNDHIPFLDYCHKLGMQVLVPASNYNLGAFGTPPDMVGSISALINSFESGNDYHPAIYGITIGSELDQSRVPIDYVIAYTKKWMEIENVAYSGFRKIPIGHPISFATNGPGWAGYYPCFGYLDKLLPALLSDKTRELNERLMLCPHTYNEARFLFNSAKINGNRGWVDLAYERYNLPILICEIGCSRLVRVDYENVIMDQLESCIKYDNTNKLVGACYFQYVDKVWMPRTTEGSFGLYHNTDAVTSIVRYGQRDFISHIEMGCKDNYLNIQILEANPALEVLRNAYTK